MITKIPDPTTTSLLLVERDPETVEQISFGLRSEGYQVRVASLPDEWVQDAGEYDPDLIILDVVVWKSNGNGSKTGGNKTTAPILLTTNRLREWDSLSLLDHGVVDFIVKPFRISELVSRVRVALSRPQDSTNRADVSSGSIRLDLLTRRAYKHDAELTLSPREFELLAALVSHRGSVLSREELLNRVWCDRFSLDTRTVDVDVHWLRQKVEEDPSYPVHIVTVRGTSYRFVE